MKLTDLLQVLPVCERLPLKHAARPALYQPPSYSGFVAPPLRAPDSAKQQLRAPIVLISAPGAVGKSTLAAHIAADRATALWDLSRLTIGDNTFVGTLVSTFGADKLSGILGGVAAGRTLFVFDAFDEAELLSGWERVESFVRELWTYMADAPQPAAIMLARTETAELIDLVLTDLSKGAPRHALLEIDYFDRASAKRFVAEQLRVVYESVQHETHPEPFERALEGTLSQISAILAADVPDPWQVAACRSFLGYAPVLQAIAAHLSQFSNYQEAAASLDTTGFGAAQRDVLPALMHGLLAREHAKFTQPLMARAVPPGEKSPDWSTLYDVTDQLRRVFFYHTEDTDALRVPGAVPGWLATDYSEALRSFLPNHPFLKGRGFAGPAFRDFAVATLLAGSDVQPLIEAWLESEPYVPTPLFAPFYESSCHGIGSGAHAGLLYDSAAAQFGLDNPTVNVFVNPEGDQHMHALTVLGAPDKPEEGFSISLRVTPSEPLAFRHRLRNAVINVDGRVVLGATSHFEIADVELEAKELEIRCSGVVIRTMPGRPRVLIEASVGPTIPAPFRVDVKFGAQLLVKWPGAQRHPWAQYYSPSAFEEPRDLQGAMLALQRILRWFRKDRRQDLSRHRELIDYVVVGHSSVRAEMRDFLLERGILRVDGMFYRLVAEDAQRLGINWASLLSTTPPAALAPVLDEFLAGTQRVG